MHFRDSPDSLNGLGIPGNIWFRRFTVTYTIYVYALGKYWENFGETLRKLWENFEKTLNNILMNLETFSLMNSCVILLHFFFILHLPNYMSRVFLLFKKKGIPFG